MTVNPITLREFADIPVERLKGVGDKKQAALETIGIRTRARPRHDLSPPVGRPDERGADRRPRTRAGSAGARDGPFGHQADDPQPAHDGERRGRGRLGPHGRGVLQSAVARAPTAARDCRSRSSARPTRTGVACRCRTRSSTSSATEPRASCPSIRRARRHRSPPGSWPAGSRRPSAGAPNEASPIRSRPSVRDSPRPGRAGRRTAIDPRARLDAGEGAGASSSGVRRAPPRAARARPAQA